MTRPVVGIYGPMVVEAKGRVRRGVVLTVKTPHRELEVYASSTGRSLRVWDHKQGRELK